MLTLPFSFNNITLFLHIISGFTALFSGGGAILLTTKGGIQHKRMGRIYVYTMAFVSLSSLLLYILDPTTTRQFLSLVAVFSFYFVFTGFRVIIIRNKMKQKQLAKNKLNERNGVNRTLFNLWDQAAVIGMLGSGIGLLLMGVNQLVINQDRFGIVIIVFGSIATVFGVQDSKILLRNYNNYNNIESNLNSPDPIHQHLVRMSAGYIATVTAFSTVNFTFLPLVLRWLWPTLIGAPAISITAKKLKKQRKEKEEKNI
eukprot:gb/GECH01000531.1/.p1 GENE.gb/GECH01000531.1/~~gb/GECH01000531.1/.p1  ORF type:complete len:257 (+),score=48.46 gb/GECH01000531.1/:1-771(+)